MIEIFGGCFSGVKDIVKKQVKYAGNCKTIPVHLNILRRLSRFRKKEDAETVLLLRPKTEKGIMQSPFFVMPFFKNGNLL